MQEGLAIQLEYDDPRLVINELLCQFTKLYCDHAGANGPLSGNDDSMN